MPEVAERSPDRSQFFAACLGALALFAAAYSNSLKNGFHFDDIHVVQQNLFVRDLANVPRFFTDARTFSSLPANAVYRPLVSLSVAIDYAIAGGFDPVAFHVTQLLLFAAVGAMLFALYTRLGEVAGHRDTRYVALLAATFFCVHTANTQTGNYIAARSELLSALGILGAFLVYLYAPRSRRWHLYLLPMIAGALAKNLAVLFAPLLLAYKLLIEDQLSVADIFSRRAGPRVRAALLSSLPAFVAAFALFVFIERMSALGQSYGGGSRGAYLATQAWVWVRYVGLYFLPVGLTADTDLKLFSGPDARTLAGVALLVGSLALIWWTSRAPRFRPAAFGLLWFWITLGPTSSIIPLAEVTNDHRVFLPYVGLNFAVVWLLASWATGPATTGSRKRRIVFWSAASIVLMAHAVGTFQRNKVWRSDETLWKDVAAKSPTNGRGLMNYGIALMQRGSLVEARELFVRAQQFSPNYSYLEVNLGVVSDALGDEDAAESHFQRGIALEPATPAVHRHYAYWLLRRGRGPEALDQLRQLVRLSPGDGDARDRLMQLDAAIGSADELAVLATESARLNASDSIATAYASGNLPPALTPATDDSNGWYLLGWSLTQGERHVEAAQAYRAAVARDPRNAAAWNNLGWTLGKLGFNSLAVSPLEQAIAIAPSYRLARNNLAWVRSELARSRGS